MSEPMEQTGEIPFEQHDADCQTITIECGPAPNQAMIRFPKSCVCILPMATLLRHLPTPILLEGFRRGKNYRRREGLRKRMENRRYDE